MATKSIVESLKQLRDDLKTWTTNNLAKRQKTITGAATTITDSNLTASRALVSNSSGKVAVSDVTATELSYLDGVTSNVQTQLNAKAASSSLSNYLLKSSVGAASGAASLDSSGKVPSSQLPSYVDDVLEYTSKSNFPTSGESGKIYVATDTNLTYRWTGSAYVEISQSIALGETSSTAYRGDRGAAAYTHSQTTSGTVHGINTDYLKNVTSDVQTQLDAKAASSHTHSAATTSAAGFMSASDKSKLDGITASADSVAFTQSVTSGTKIGTITINGIATGLWAPANVDTHYISSTVVGSSATALANTTSALTNGNVYLNHIENGTVRNSHKISGSGNTTVTSDASGNIIVSSTGSSYGVATSSTLGLVKSGTDITVDSSGNVSVNDDSHNHVISNIDGLQSSLDGKLSTSGTAAKATADADGNTISSTYRKLSDNNFSTALTLSTDDVTSINFGNYGYIDYEAADKKLEIGSNYGRPDNEHLLYSNINFGEGNATLYADNNINVNATNSITLSADTIYIGQLCSGLLGLSYRDVYIGDQLKALGGLTTAEIGYLDGVTSSIQAQLNSKLSTSGGTVTGSITFEGNITLPTDASITGSAYLGSNNFSLKNPSDDGTILYHTDDIYIYDGQIDGIVATSHVFLYGTTIAELRFMGDGAHIKGGTSKIIYREPDGDGNGYLDFYSPHISSDISFDGTDLRFLHNIDSPSELVIGKYGDTSGNIYIRVSDFYNTIDLVGDVSLDRLKINSNFNIYDTYNGRELIYVTSGSDRYEFQIGTNIYSSGGIYANGGIVTDNITCSGDLDIGALGTPSINFNTAGCYMSVLGTGGDEFMTITAGSSSGTIDFPTGGYITGLTNLQVNGSNVLTAASTTVVHYRVTMVYGTSTANAKSSTYYIYLNFDLSPKSSINASTMAQLNSSLYSKYPSNTSMNAGGVQIPGICYNISSSTWYSGIYTLASSTATAYFKFGTTTLTLTDISATGAIGTGVNAIYQYSQNA